ncbi:hypothetical protein DSO57_1039346 [Entomophthora muscae]|uniref:Uncharacterized protein n=1 Tax=Entomophthora muscae TaxID=34485 RepID=A0ACC2SB70_9FUNG|nr:hypothetical protein DSO57_1039346 [Entomophthora muscae]
MLLHSQTASVPILRQVFLQTNNCLHHTRFSQFLVVSSISAPTLSVTKFSEFKIQAPKPCTWMVLALPLASGKHAAVVIGLAAHMSPTAIFWTTFP